VVNTVDDEGQLLLRLPPRFEVEDEPVQHVLEQRPQHQAKHNEAITEFVELPNRGHSLTIDHGWREVATAALEFLARAGVAPASGT